MPAQHPLYPDLQIVLEIVHKECHVIPQTPLDGISSVGLQVLALHLQGPAVLQLGLHPPDAQQVFEDDIIPAAKTKTDLLSHAHSSGPKHPLQNNADVRPRGRQGAEQ